MKLTKILLTLVFIFSTLSAQENMDQGSMNVLSGYINVDGGKLYYETTGGGEDIVFIHDGLIHHEIWEGQFDFFAKNYRVVRYDRRGYGKSSLPETEYSNVEDLNEVFKHLKIEKATLFGMSAGGGVAIDFTLKYPDKVKELVLAGAVVSGYGYTEHMTTRGGRVKNLMKLFSEPDKFIQYFGWDDPYQVNPENEKARKRCLSLLKANPQNVGIKKYQFLKPPDRPAVENLKEIKVPALILVGEFDIPDVHAHSGAIESGIPGAKRKIIMNAGHLIPVEQPEIFNGIVVEFLATVKTAEH